MSVSKYLADFRTIDLTISDMTEGEKSDGFVDGLKPDVRLEVTKSRFNSFKDAPRILLRIDSAIWRAGSSIGFRQDISIQHPV